MASAAQALAAGRIKGGDPARVMGYYDGADVPVYDHLVEEFAVCDRWFSSVPGATWPNRLYALCGVAAGSRDDRPVYELLLYHQVSFVRHLDAYHVSGGGIPSIPACCALSMFATGWGTISASVTSAKPVCRG